MNLDKLKQAEADFLARYEGGFAHPELAAIGKKHNMDRMISNVQEAFRENRFGNSGRVVSDMEKLISRASMVSLFEKPKFRSFVKSLDLAEKEFLASGLHNRLHGNQQGQQQGFDMMVSILANYKLAKWTLVSILPVYFHPNAEVFIKPTTTKAVIEFLELKDIQYNPRPNWEFYNRYRKAILEMKDKVSATLSPNNAAFTGFLMMVIKSGNEGF